MKRTLSVFLLICMLFSLLPVAALAADAKKESDVHCVFHAQFYVEANPGAGLKGKINVVFDAGGTIGTLYLPGSVDVSQLHFSWVDTGIKVSKGGQVLQNGSAPVADVNSRITFKLKKGAAFSLVTIKTVQGSADVKPMFLELDEGLGTIDAMNSDKTHETKCTGVVRFDGVESAMTMKGRGNSTWKMPKKPYNITLSKKAELIPHVTAKKWSLIANYLDNSLLRNKIAMDLADALGIGLKTRFVDVWMNGEYLGNYLLTPKNDYDAPDGGYVLESDNYYEHGEGADPQFQLPDMWEIGPITGDEGYYNRITVKDIGDDAADAGTDPAAIEAYFLDAWSALRDYDSEDYQNYFDMDSWAKMFLMYEVSKTYDCYAGSMLMHRDGLTDADKLIAGPAWDYDVSFGRTLHKFLVGVSEPIQLNAEGWYNDSIGLMVVDQPVSLLQEFGKHPDFMQRVAEIYNENKAYFEDLAGNVDRQQALIRDSAMMNNARWGTHSLCADYLIAPGTMSLLGTGKYALQYRVTLTWDDYVYNLREYCTKRVMWLTDHLRLQAPVGTIVKQELDDGTIVLQAALSAGNDANTFRWQSSADGAAWTDIEGAASATYVPPVDTLGTTQYRCVVTNAGSDIWTTHGGLMKTSAQTVLAPATVSVRMEQAALEAGTMTLVLDGQQVGDYTFAPSGNGWTICSADGKYLKPLGQRLILSDTPFAWTFRDGTFTAETPVAVTVLGWIITLGYQRSVYLTAGSGQPALSVRSGASVSFLKQVAD